MRKLCIKPNSGCCVVNGFSFVGGGGGSGGGGGAGGGREMPESGDCCSRARWRFPRDEDQLPLPVVGAQPVGGRAVSPTY